MILAVSSASSDPILSTAAIAAEDAGYRSGVSDAGCDIGTAEAVGLTEGFYSSVSVYFDTEEAANQARDAFAARGTGSVVAQIVAICLD